MIKEPKLFPLKPIAPVISWSPISFFYSAHPPPSWLDPLHFFYLLSCILFSHFFYFLISLGLLFHTLFIYFAFILLHGFSMYIRSMYEKQWRRLTNCGCYFAAAWFYCLGGCLVYACLCYFCSCVFCFLFVLLDQSCGGVGLNSFCGGFYFITQKDWFQNLKGFSSVNPKGSVVTGELDSSLDLSFYASVLKPLCLVDWPLRFSDDVLDLLRSAGLGVVSRINQFKTTLD